MKDPSDMSNVSTLEQNIAIYRVHTWELHNWLFKRKSQKYCTILQDYDLCWVTFIALLGHMGPTGYRLDISESWSKFIFH